VIAFETAPAGAVCFFAIAANPDFFLEEGKRYATNGENGTITVPRFLLSEKHGRRDRMKIKVNGVELFYRQSGEGAPLLLLHGNGEDHHVFDSLAVRLAAHYRVYAIDSRNHGRSERTSEYDYDVMAGDMRAFIAALELAPVNIVGFSDGAIIALLLAMKHGELISRMALLGVNLTPDDFSDESLSYLRAVYQQTKDPLFGLMLEQPDIALDDLRDVTVPALVMGGDRDIYRSELFGEIVGALPRAELRIMRGHEHDSYLMGRDLLYPDLVRFFR